MNNLSYLINDIDNIKHKLTDNEYLILMKRIMDTKAEIKNIETPKTQQSMLTFALCFRMIWKTISMFGLIIFVITKILHPILKIYLSMSNSYIIFITVIMFIVCIIFKIFKCAFNPIILPIKFIFKSGFNIVWMVIKTVLKF